MTAEVTWLRGHFRWRHTWRCMLVIARGWVRRVTLNLFRYLSLITLFLSGTLVKQGLSAFDEKASNRLTDGPMHWPTDEASGPSYTKSATRKTSSLKRNRNQAAKHSLIQCLHEIWCNFWKSCNICNTIIGKNQKRYWACVLGISGQVSKNDMLRCLNYIGKYWHPFQKSNWHFL